MSSSDHKPPKWADRFLQWYCHPDFIEEIQGDLHESFQKRSDSDGHFAAQIGFVADVFRSLSFRKIQFPVYSPITQIAMLKNNLILFIRKLGRRRGFAAINITGLSVSLAAALLLYLYIANELSFDKFNNNADRTYRVFCALASPGESIEEFPYTPPTLAPAVQAEITDIEHIARIFEEGNPIITVGDKAFGETQFYTVDSAFFGIFTGHFLAGDPLTALKNPHSAVITKSCAEKYFGIVSSALNKDINVNGTNVYNVTGIVDDFPSTSHFRFQGLLSVDYANENLNPDNWLAHWPTTYLVLRKDRTASTVQDNIRRMTDRVLEPVYQRRYGKSYSEQKAAGALQEYRLQPLLKVHLYSATMGEKGNILHIYLFAGIGVVLLAIACFNYINLATARSTWEARSTGIRKVLGATRGQIYRLFLTDAMGTTFIAFMVALAVSQIVLMVDAAFVAQFIPDKSIPFHAIGALALVSVGLGLFSGIIPSKLLSSFEPVDVLKGQLARGAKGGILRQFLVVVQFAGSMALIMCTVLVSRQMEFISSVSLGFDKEELIVLNHIDQLGNRKSILKDEVSKLRFVEHASLSYGHLGKPSNGAAFTPVEMLQQRKDLVIGMPIYIGDEDYIKTIGVRLLMGHAFPRDLPEDRRQIILNQEAIRQVGWAHRKEQDVVGKMIDVNGRRYELAGVVADYHFTSLREKITPMAILSHYWNDYALLTIRLKKGSNQIAISELENVWNHIGHGVPFEYRFVDDDLSRLYAEEESQATLFRALAAISVFIACLGLLGLAAFLAEKSAKEISIRKVLGASIQSIVVRLSQNMVKLIVLSFLFATPVAWYLMNEWLNNFAYRIALNALPFMLAGISTLFIALITMSLHTIKAALTNPAETLKHE